MIKYAPMTGAQKRFYQAYDEGARAIIQTGPAGTGKTAVALWNMMNEYLLDPTRYDGILILRPPESTVDLGFMPGNEQEKEAYYEETYRQVINEMFKFNSSYDNMKSLDIITFKTTANLRGLTFRNKLILVDEFQSCDIHSLKTTFTRLGENSRIMFCGDFNQNDLRHKKGTQQSGFKDFMTILQKVKSYDNYDIEMIEYCPDDVVRDGLVRDFIIACYELGL